MKEKRPINFEFDMACFKSGFKLNHFFIQLFVVPNSIRSTFNIYIRVKTALTGRTMPWKHVPNAKVASAIGLIPLELQPKPSESRQKVREAYLIHRGQTISPDEINRRNEH